MTCETSANLRPVLLANRVFKKFRSPEIYATGTTHPNSLFPKA
ncbi:hypothetical protein [Chamaesiphon sp. VAR_48_metabat_403]|nr:hypothetical protein [Chamaesiphon sp. VAR_48_metabat_403]